MRAATDTAVLVADAAQANPHVPGILSGAEPPVASRDGYVALGGADEATWYVEEHGPAWHATPDAVAWLAAACGDAAGSSGRSCLRGPGQRRSVWPAFAEP